MEGLGNFSFWLQWIVPICIAIYWYLNKNNNYWKKRNVPYEPAASFLTFFRSVYSKEFQDAEVERYQKYGKVYGMFEGRAPTITVADPDLLRDILVKDFQVFGDRREFSFGDPILDKNVSNLKGEHWKRVRTLITPAFSSGKMRKMTKIINDSAQTAVQNFLRLSEKEKIVDCKRVFGAFSMDVVASSAFATKIDSLNDPNNPFVTHARNAMTFSSIWKMIVFMLLPAIVFNKLGLNKLIANASAFFRDVSLQVIEERRRKGQKGNDFLQLMMDASQEHLEGDMKMEGFKTMGLQDDALDDDDRCGYGENNKEIFKNTYKKSLSQDELLGQCVMFFMVGYETTASTVSFAAYNLALNPTCQEKLIHEIDEIFQEKGELTYDAIREMKYLDMVVSETLRIFPAVFKPDRMSLEDYKLGDTGITIPKGMIVGYPVYALHHDPEYYPDPEKFDPERFTPENRRNRHPYVYLPFGAGPRNCLGMRFALMEIKLCLANVLRHLRFHKCHKTKVPPKYLFGLGLLSPKEMHLVIEKRMDVPGA